MVLIVIARILEARVTNRLCYFGEHLDYVSLWYSDSEPVVGPINDFYLILRPEVLQRICSSRLNLEVVWQGIVLYNTKESFGSKYPHLDPPLEGGRSPPTLSQRLPQSVGSCGSFLKADVAKSLPELSWSLVVEQSNSSHLSDVVMRLCHYVRVVSPEPYTEIL